MSSIWDAPGETTPTQTTQSAGGGGSIWDSPGSSAPATTTTSAPAAKGGGGGGILGSIGHAFTNVGHFVASKAALAGHDISSMAGGLKTGVVDPYWNLITTGHPYAHGTGQKIDNATASFIGGIGPSLDEAIHHPLRDPFNTLTWALPVGHGLGKLGAGVHEAAGALKAGEGTGAAVQALKHPTLLETPRTLKAPGGEPVSLATSHNALRRLYQAGHDAYVQKMIDTKPESVVAKYGAQRMSGTLAEVSRARVRMRQAIVSNLRRSSQPLKGEIVKAAKAQGLELDNHPKTLAQAALELVSHNTTPEEAILRAESAIRHGINPELNAANVHLYHELQALDLVHNHGETVGINPAFKSLAHAESILHEGGTKIDAELAQRNLRSEQGLTSRRDLPAAVTQRLKPFSEEKVTPTLKAARDNFARVDKLYQKALDQQADYHNGTSKVKTVDGYRIGKGAPNPFNDRVLKLGLEREKSLARVQKLEPFHTAGETMADMRPTIEPSDVTRAAVSDLHSQLPELLQQKIEAHYGGDMHRFADDMVGVHNGTVTNPEAVRLFHQLTQASLSGRTFTPLTQLEKAVPGAPMARSAGAVLGAPNEPLNTHFTTGRGLLGERDHQPDVVEQVARHWHAVNRFFNTQEWRDLVAKTGSDTRRSTRDILVRVDDRVAGGTLSKAQAISPEINTILGRLEEAPHTPESEGELAAVDGVLQQFVNHLFPGREAGSEAASLEANAGIGTEAPKGYKWVDASTAENSDLMAFRTPPTGMMRHVGRFMDNVNGAVTAATVYFKLGHIFTRVFTNAATNIMQGSASPLNIRSALDVWHELSPEERLQALASAGTHYYEALPEGTGRIQRGIQHGFSGKANVGSPQWWAKVIDAPFRFNSLAYEIRKSAYGSGVDGFRAYMHDLHDYNNLDPAQRAEVDGIVRRANREAIAYDRLNANEKQFLARAIWFYPWIKGSTVFTANAMFEHPFKFGALGQMGVQGREEQQREFGDLPSYSYGLFLLAHGKLPLVADFNTFNPMGTAGTLLEAPSHLSNLEGMLNPVLGGAAQVASGTDAYGNKTPHPISQALKGLISSVPEAQIAEAYLARNQDQSHREFPAVPGDPWSKSWLGETLRMLLGPGAPRRFNPEAAHSLAQRERTGK